MATLTNNTGKIIATDIYQHKLDKIKENVKNKQDEIIDNFIDKI